MKQRFNTLDLQVALHELSVCFSGCRVTNIYDINNKTYLIKLHKPDSKAVILIESGIRIHCTEFDWPKNMIPSGFSMKMRKHLRSRRLEKVTQVGADRIADLQFGSGEAAYHLILELYDKGNILLTDFEYTIISVLRPRTDENQDVKFTVREKYPLSVAKQHEDLTLDKIKELIDRSKDNDDIKKVLTFNLTYGAPLIEHCLAVADFPEKCIIGKTFNKETDIEKLFEALQIADKIVKQLTSQVSKGYIITKKTKAIKLEKSKEIDNEEIVTYEEFHPYLFKKNESQTFIEFESFDKAVDEFFSKIESQKIEIKELNQNKEAVKKLENVKKDHQKRLEELKLSQTEDELKAALIEYNLDLVDRAIFLVNNAIANQLDWNEIKEIIEEAQEENHVVALAIKDLKLEINHIVLELNDPEDENTIRKVEIDLGLNAFRNSRRYYDNKKHSIVKEQKTIDAGDKALKSAEKKTIELLKQASKIKTIGKSRKQYWFEKFYWFISSENYLIIGGRDQQQNEIVVKKYLKPGDLYVHADVQGASSIVIKNPSGNPVPPKTINEAGCMAVCYSVAWEAKVLTSAYWVYHNQVSKQAPSGEYLKTGSFMIRGKKNFIPQTALVFGFGLLYKLDDESVFRHKDDRKVKTTEEEMINEMNELNVEYDEVPLVEDDDSENKTSQEPKSDLIIEDVENDKQDENDDNKQQQDENKEEDDDDEMEKSTNLFPETSFQIKLVSEIDENSLKNEQATNKEKVEDEPRVGKQGGKEATKKINQPLKRGQKSRLAKMKTKYKDQDDEDRELVMQYLAPGGKSTKTDEKSIKCSNDKKTKQIDNPNKNKNQQQKQQQAKKDNDFKSTEISKETASSQTSTLNNQETNVNEEIEIEEENVQDEIEVIDSLTGNPLDEDELLFCLTVCAPYTTLQNYKHKVKMIPGTTKRGQAVKTAIEMFTRDKATTQREKDLIKSNLTTKEQDISRNMPGKVKLSAPNLMKFKKK